MPATPHYFGIRHHGPGSARRLRDALDVLRPSRVLIEGPADASDLLIMIEFDHQLPVALEGPRLPNHEHVHTVVRTPNGNDYGKDLLKLHYEQHKNDPNHRHQ